MNIFQIGISNEISPILRACGGIADRSFKIFYVSITVFCLFSKVSIAFAEVGIPLKDPSEIAGKVDELLRKSWKGKGVSPAVPASDEEYLRRTCLNLSGRIPSVTEAEDFLEDASAEKRQLLVDRLLDGPGYIRHFSGVWRAAYLPELTTTPNPILTPERFDAWIRDHLRRNSSYGTIVRELILPPAPSEQGLRSGSALFYQAKSGKPENIAAGICRSVLGVRLECAQCHDHPFSKWKQEDFWSQAAFFSSAQVPALSGGSVEGVVPPVGEGKVKIPGKEITVGARFLGGDTLAPDQTQETVRVYVDWITSPQNPYFARAVVNRLWNEMFGAGIVNPVDDLDEQNPPSHPEVLALLSEDFIKSDFDIKRLIRIIVRTEAYQLSSAWTEGTDDRHTEFARMRVRPLSVDQLFESLSQATGYYEPYVEQGAFVETPRRRIQQVFQNESSDGEARTSILQALALMNGEFVSEAVDVEAGRTLSGVVEASFLNRSDKVRTLYLATLTRVPTEEELRDAEALLDESLTEPERKRRYGDLWWMLLNCSEFVLNH